MMKFKMRLVLWGEIFFLAAVALLIIRDNAYPWPIKRASDILFSLAALCTIAFLAASHEWPPLVRIFKKISGGLFLIFFGLLIASLSSSVIGGVSVGARGILAFGRFVEAGMILALIGFFQSRDPVFYKKAALAQLSTLVYLPAFFIPWKFYIPRFQLFENWPSNVGYYLIVSLSLVLVWLLKALSPFQKRFWLYYAATAGFMGILIWTQSRASWLALTIALVIMGAAQGRRGEATRRRRILLAWFAIIISTAALGFMAIPRISKNIVFTRIFPQIKEKVQFTEVESSAIIKGIITGGISPEIIEPSRLYLWKVYGQRVLGQPLGQGLNYPLVSYGGSLRGPHNTILEILILGGIPALLGILSLFVLGFKNIIASVKTAHDPAWPLYLLASLTALTVASFFDNMSTFRLMWVILGVGIFASRQGFMSESLPAAS